MENRHLVKRFGATVGKLGIPFKIKPSTGEVVYRFEDHEQIIKLYKEFKARDQRAVNYCSETLNDRSVIWVEDYSGKLLEPYIWAKTGEELTASQIEDLQDEMIGKLDRDQDSWSPKMSPEETHREKMELKGSKDNEFYLETTQHLTGRIV